jgi:hypothetical protein
VIRVSRKFVEAVKLADQPAYRIAQQAGIDSAALSKILHANGKIWPKDRRVLAVATVLGLDPGECFENHPGEAKGKSLLTGPEMEVGG